MDVEPAHLDFLLESCNGATGEYNPRTDEARFTARWMALLGLLPSDPAASRLSAWNDRCHPDDRHVLRTAHQQIERGEADRYRVRLRMRHASGEWRVLEICAATPAPKGEVGGGWLRAVALDHAGQSDDERRWRAMAEMSADWYWASDAEHRISNFEASAGWPRAVAKTRLIGRRRDELEGAVPGEGGWEAFHAVLDRHEPFKGLGYRLAASDGGPEIWVEIDGRPLFDAEGRFCGYEGVGRDVSEARRATSALRRNLELVDSLFESIPVPVVMKDLEGRYVRVNRAMCDLFAVERESVVGRRPSSVVDDEAGRMHADADARLLDGRESRLQYEAHQVSASGRSIDTLVTKSVMKDADGHVIGLVATVVDISTIKAFERELAEAKAAAEAASKAKSTFLSTMSHEIRTPMNAIIGMSYLALQGPLEDKQRRFIQTVHRSAEALLMIINDILDFSKIEAGQLDIEQTDFSLADLMDDLAGLLTMRAQDKDLELIFDRSPHVPDRLIGDPVRLIQVLVNLGGNAVKFTERGEVVVGIQRIGGDDRSVLLRFEVRDTGVGMSPGVCERLFRPFVQADVSTSRQYGGTGLGLAISQRLVELMGGHIAVDSQPAKGSRFWFDLRLGVRPESLRAAAPRAPRSLRLLVVDDNTSARQVLVGMAGALGQLAEGASDASQALEMLIERDARGQPFEVVLIDWKMPMADGVECLRSISRTQLAHRPRSVLMVTAFEQEDLRLRLAANDLDCPTILSKPVSPSGLIDACAEAIGLPVRPGAPRTAPESSLQEHQAGLRGARLLLVEDNAINQELARELLTSCGVEVTVAADGQQALEILSRERFEGVLMDCQMPIMDGYAATRELRRDPRLAALPVIAMTANAMIGDRERALEAGMNDHIGKPIRIDEMFATLARWVHPRPPDVVPTLAAGRGAQLDGIPGIDASVWRARTDGDVSLYRRLLAMFCRELAEFPAPFQRALDAGDIAQLRRLAHTLKSTAGTLGALDVERAAQSLETACSVDAKQQALQPVLDSLSRSLTPVLASLREQFAS